MVITPNGPIGLSAVRLVEEVLKHDQGHVPTPLQSMVERTAVNWDQQMRHRNVIQTPAVSFNKVNLKESNVMQSNNHVLFAVEPEVEIRECNQEPWHECHNTWQRNNLHLP